MIMKKLTLSIAALALAGGLAAQSPQLSFGIDAGIPLGDDADLYSLSVGPAVGFELPLGNKLGLTAQLAYQIALVKSEFDGFSFSLLPIQAGLKYYFMESQEGFYGHAQLGVHSVNSKFEFFGVSISDTQTDLSWAIGAGYQMEKLDIGLRYNVITNGGDGFENTSYIGIRIAYLLSL